ncbi:polysaccharide biosynthesis protein [Listeria booriae]|uniref:polysaccharide biosynthesis protein n=1 Tax=Listeria booriae TaxID=1552123 RepID=UPI001625184A|nr:SDR family NAD(P)-dependent oxidoreductase [Listeria booriae]MBC2195692.1 polysaccharide biosynthesis protein [Listeria booriae]
MKPKKTLLIGAGEAGRYIYSYITNNKQYPYDVVGFLDDNLDAKLEDKPHFGKLAGITHIAKLHGISCIIFAIPSLPTRDKQHFLLQCMEANLEINILPELTKILTNEKNFTMTSANYQHLIKRPEFQLKSDSVSEEIAGQIILVTGAGGSIGSEICRQIIKAQPETIILLGHGEGSIYEIHHELQKIESTTKLVPVIADIKDEFRITEIFDKYNPDIVYHAAAHKHVPLMEMSSYEAITNNIVGTQNLVRIATTFNTSKFVMISTDKAVKPSTIMGATKRLAEKVVQYYDTISPTTCCVVRFGNVLGSRGSVIPLFHNQLYNNEPITLTDPQMERYFMTIPEASKLVIQASLLTKGAEIFVLDMGEPIKIIDLVYRLADLAGLEREHVDINYIGIRAGEKVTEELFTETEKSPQQVYEKIFVGENIVTVHEINAIYELLQSFRDDSECERRTELLRIANQQKEENHVYAN